MILWITGAFFLAIRWAWNKYLGSGKANKWLWPVPYLMLAVAAFALLFAPLPFGWGTVAGLGAYLFTWLFGTIGAPGRIIAGLALIVVLIVGFGDLIKDRKPDGMAKTMLFVAPVLCLAAGGALAAQVLQVTHLVGDVGPTVVTSLT